MDRRNPLYVAFRRYKVRQNKPISTLYSRYLLMYCTAVSRKNVNKTSAVQDCTNVHCELKNKRMHVTSLLYDLAAPLVYDLAAPLVYDLAAPLVFILCTNIFYYFLQ